MKKYETPEIVVVEVEEIMTEVTPSNDLGEW